MNEEVKTPTDIQVIGLGYVGLPLAILLADSGLRVAGVDIDPAIRDAVRAGDALSNEDQLPKLLRDSLQSGQLQITAAPGPADVTILAVPTPAVRNADGTGRADLSILHRAFDDVVPFLRRGDLVVLTSTSPIGTTEALAARLADLRGSGHGVRFSYAPERVLPGHIFREMCANDRMVGGLSHEAAHQTAAVFARFCKGEIGLTDAKTAEMVKLAENASRDVAIAFANELAGIARHHGLDPKAVIAAANCHPRVSILEPGIGVGGHCIPVDPLFLQQDLPIPARLLAVSRQVNDARPAEVVRDLEAWMGDGTLGLLGLTYKPDIGDLRESPALEIAETLIRSFPTRVRAHDPHAMPDTMPAASLDDVLALDRIAVLVPHAAFDGLPVRDAGMVWDMSGRLSLTDASHLNEAQA